LSSGLKTGGVDDGKVLTVLIVTSDSGETETLRELLEPKHPVKVASTGREALQEAWSTAPPDLILLDVMLSEMDGYEVCRKLKAEARSRDIPVILMAIDREVGARGLELGAADYITKPFIPPALLARVETHLTLKRHLTMLSDLFFIDPLTGLPNRRRFEEVLNREWRRGRREGTPLSMILMGVDFCDAFNYKGGSTERDKCFKDVAKVLNASLRRATDFLARYSNDQFATILAATDARGATMAAEMLRERINQQQIEVTYDNVVDKISMSFGSASIVPRSDSSPNILKRASAKMLAEAMDRGRNRVESLDFDPPSLPWFA
jgi:diguanylate cyclase (GGDEF)-like protein